LADTRLKIAVFIDFDNIEIGVKSTLGVQFDIGIVLEALKERGDVVSKVAYGDWTRAGDYSRSLTQHATKLVQRNLTPGGDKNGADINLALDALEMAFTHGHINAYVIVGGDSDFITLVEKLKQYDKQIFVVGGRAFTSLVMQRNCHEFIAYENLVGSRRFQERGPKSAPVTTQQTPLDQVVPLVRRALKVLTDREVTPQLGLLKSTLLQLDSTFSERTYGAGSFRDFAQKLAAAGHVVLRESGRNVLVELSENGHGVTDDSLRAAPAVESARPIAVDAPQREASVPVNGGGRAADGIREVRRLLQSAARPPRWPMYIRQIKQFLRGVDPTFDERKFGFETLNDLMRACQRDGLLRVERDRQGGMRIFPGTLNQDADFADRSDRADYADSADRANAEADYADSADPANLRDRQAEAFEPAADTPADAIGQGWPSAVQASTAESEVVDGDVVQEIDVRPVVDVEDAPAAVGKPSKRRSTKAARPASEGRTSRKAADGTPAPTRARKTPSKPRSSRSRTRTSEAPAE
jgi:uncharacterized LabA/DUF88 family protein